jgi:hypothetical protein
MRTTVNIDDDVLAMARRCARLRGESLGSVLSDLIRRGLSAGVDVDIRDGLVTFRLPPDSPVVTTERVRHIEREGS